jgi:hypothetical protein
MKVIIKKKEGLNLNWVFFFENVLILDIFVF